MAKPGDVMEFRSGLHGIDAPQNLGILVTRQRRKGVPWVTVATIKGRLDLKAEHVTKRVFKQRFDGDLRNEEATLSRLRQLLELHTDGRLAEEAEDDLGALEEDLWEAACDQDRAWTEDELAALHYGDAASGLQRKQVRDALDRCRRRGVGRFETVAGRGDTWRPWTRTERDQMRVAFRALEDLRARLVAVEETEEGRAFVRVELADAALTDADQATLAWVKDAMVQSIEQDGQFDRLAATEPLFGIGGFGAVQAFGMDLHRILGFLAQDWIRSAHTSRSSDYIHFLLESGLWNSEDAVQGLMRRHVNQEPFFQHKPDERANADANELPEPAPGDPGREDLRHLRCHTIDPPDAKDFDDAVGTEDLGDGRTKLWVHIADVSHYVRPGSYLDKHAKDRATSVYLPGRVLPMLPHRIADHLCSLRDDGDRFALSAAITIEADGSVGSATFHKALIRVTENLAYADALARRDAGNKEFQALFDLAARMRSHRKGLALETGELKVLLEESGFSSLEKHADDATRMIETFMVTANEAVARHLADHDQPLLYRCHPLPDAQKAERFGHQAQVLGFDIDFALPEKAQKEASASGGMSLLDQLKAGGGSLNLFGGGMNFTGGGAPADDEDDDGPVELEAPEADKGFAGLTPDEQDAWLAPFRNAVEAFAAASPNKAEVGTLCLLRCMGRAYYTPDNEGHFGLASTHYCHFTSPIRRYPDLVVHRNLKAMIAGEEPLHPADELQRMCDHCSDQERAADALERRIKSACLVLASLHGETAFSTAAARITGVMASSLWVLLDDGIEARIPARDLPGGPYSVDEWESMLFVSDIEAPQRFSTEDLAEFGEFYDDELGEMRKVRARLGNRVSVKLAGRDVAEGKTGAQLQSWT